MLCHPLPSKVPGDSDAQEQYEDLPVQTSGQALASMTIAMVGVATTQSQLELGCQKLCKIVQPIMQQRTLQQHCADSSCTPQPIRKMPS